MRAPPASRPCAPCVLALAEEANWPHRKPRCKDCSPSDVTGLNAYDNIRRPEVRREAGQNMVLSIRGENLVDGRLRDNEAGGSRGTAR